MNFEEYRKLVTGLTVGKKLPTAIYLHIESISTIPGSLQAMLESLRKRLNIGEEFNIIKFGTKEFRISFLSYPRFFDIPHPKLARSILVNLSSGKVRDEDFTKRALR